VGSRTILDMVMKKLIIVPHWKLNLDCPACSLVFILIKLPHFLPNTKYLQIYIICFIYNNYIQNVLNWFHIKLLILLVVVVLLLLVL
jgi:hypothetical protein